MSDGYMEEQGEALAQHLRLTDSASGYVETTKEGFVVHVRKKWPGKQLSEWDGLPVEWHENVGTNKAANGRSRHFAGSRRTDDGAAG